MQDFISYARKNGIILSSKGCCQFCGAAVTGGVFECHGNAHHLAEILDFSNPSYYETRFLSVDALALQHCELHGPWNNHIHLTRLFLILEKEIVWNYSKTPHLSNIINQYKKDKSEYITPPPPAQRGRTTTSDLLLTTTADQSIVVVRQWAEDVYKAFNDHHDIVSRIAKMFLDKYYV